MKNTNTDFLIYDHSSPTSIEARRNDVEWFRQHRASVIRVRPLRTGESPFVDILAERGVAKGSYVVVINHARARDKCEEVGIGSYPFPMFGEAPKVVQELAELEAGKMVRHFRRSPINPQPSLGCGSGSGVSVNV